MSRRETYELTRKVRARFLHEASLPDYELRRMVGHANLLDRMVCELRNFQCAEGDTGDDLLPDFESDESDEEEEEEEQDTSNSEEDSSDESSDEDDSDEQDMTRVQVEDADFDVENVDGGNDEVDMQEKASVRFVEYECKPHPSENPDIEFGGDECRVAKDERQRPKPPRCDSQSKQAAGCAGALSRKEAALLDRPLYYFF